MRLPKLGKKPSGERLEKILKSPNYKEGKFENLSEPSADSSESSRFNFYGMLKELIINKNIRRKPANRLPSIKTDLKNLKSDENIIVWFGHSSLFIQLNGKKLLIDPVLSGYASSTKTRNRSYKGSDIYGTEDMPDIDYLLISHDHYDHLDYETVAKLRPKIKKVIAGLGVGAHFEAWGYDKNCIVEKDWNETAVLEEGFEIALVPARHRSGRGIKSNQTLWTAFLIKASEMKIFYSGDSGYGRHFKDIGSTYGPFELAIMECGQYSKYWKHSHMMPEEVVQAAKDLKAKKLMTCHWAKYTLSLHAWDEPIIRVTEESKRKNMPLLYPMIGEKMNLKETETSNEWWKIVP